MMNEEAQAEQVKREPVVYEYLIKRSPRYIPGITEDLEIHRVFQDYLQDGSPIFIAVFRRPMPESYKPEARYD